MPTVRPVIDAWPSRPTMEGAGVRLRRAFGQVDKRLDPFLLLDHFGSEDPADYLAGFPWHPHRGIETITYMLSGTVEHGDSLGNEGTIGPGDVQWMTAGSGIVHQEMPQPADVLEGFQLWSNLPRAHKMIEPRYRDVLAAELPLVSVSDGVQARIICGRIGELRGPVQDVATDPTYLDVVLAAGARLELDVPRGHNAFAYLYRGRALFGEPADERDAGQLVVFGDGDVVRAEASETEARLLLAAARPLGEPVAWGGPIVMNTQDELELAFREYRDGSFIKH